MPLLPRVTAAEVIRVLEKLGYALARQSGAHKIYKNTAGQRVTVSYHAGTIIKPKMLKSIFRDAGISAEEFTKFRKDL